MDKENREWIEGKSHLRCQGIRLKTGIHNLLFERKAKFIVAAYFLWMLILWIGCFSSIIPDTDQMFSQLCRGLLKLSYIFLVATGFLVVLLKIGTPIGANKVQENLWKIGLVNHAGEMPYLMKKQLLKNGSTVLEFEANGIPLVEWQNKQSRIEAALNLNITDMEYGKNRQRIILYAVSGDIQLPEKIMWKEKYLRKEDFLLVLGQSLQGQELVDLKQIPHLLLGGSTGSGKSVLLKLLVMQCVKKDALVYIADFKGGVDFSPVWHKRCQIITEEEALLNTLMMIVEELEKRKDLFLAHSCANISEYNRKESEDLQRIIFACDEIAELLDKTGLSKEKKELVTKIEGNLSIIARQGRAFGIHLILATQRPDANILSGQIRNNLDYRICGRADNVLSMIILDNADAAEKIPKSAQGLFLNHEGTVFRGYLFDENEVFEKKG